MNPLGWLLSGLGEVGTAIWLLARGGQGVFLDWLDEDPLARNRLADAFVAFVWRPLPVLAALSGLLGLIVGVSVSELLRRFHAEVVVEPPMAHILARDATPLLVGMFASGRVSVELASRLGGMRLGRELEALEALGHDPARYVVAPALTAIAAAAPIHVAAAFACMWAAAGWTFQFGAVSPWEHFTSLTLTAPTFRALLTGVLKGLTYSLIALGVGAAVGSTEARGPAAIGRQATAAFTWGLLAIFSAAAVWSALE